MSDSILGIRFFVEEVLQNRFPFDTFKHKPTRTQKGLRLHCPFCGDTDTVGKMPRGNLYDKRKWYRCYNDGCNVSMPLDKFVYKMSMEYNIDISDMDLSEIGDRGDSDTILYDSLVATKDNSIYDYLDDMQLLDKLPLIHDLVSILGLKDVTMLPQESHVRKFLEKRDAYYIHNISSRVFSDFHDDRIYIMNVDDLHGRVLSFAVRYVNKKVYIENQYSDFKKIIRLPDVTQEQEVLLNSLSSFFNVLNVEFSSHINITEGQFDSMFVDNCMAIQGVSKLGFITGHIKDTSMNILFDRDRGGYSSMLSVCGDMGVLLWSSIIDDLKRKYATDIRSIKHITKNHDINELFSFLCDKHNGAYTVDEFNKFISPYTSRDIYSSMLM